MKGNYLKLFENCYEVNRLNYDSLFPEFSTKSADSYNETVAEMRTIRACSHWDSAMFSNNTFLCTIVAQ